MQTVKSLHFSLHERGRLSAVSCPSVSPQPLSCIGCRSPGGSRNSPGSWCTPGSRCCRWCCPAWACTLPSTSTAISTSHICSLCTAGWASALSPCLPFRYESQVYTHVLNALMPTHTHTHTADSCPFTVPLVSGSSAWLGSCSLVLRCGSETT